MKQLEVQELAEALESQNVQELKELINNILHVLAAEEAIGVMEDDKVIAQVAPMNTLERAAKRTDADAWADLKRIAAELAPYWPRDIDAVEIIHDVRRDL